MSRPSTLMTIAAVISSVALVSCRNDAPSLSPQAIGHSGHGFTLGEEVVDIDYGYVDDGDKLVYAIIRSWPIDTPGEAKMNDPRYDLNPGGLPRVRYADGQLREVKTNGQIYFFLGDQLRTMRVAMDEHTDTVGTSKQKDMEGIWDFLTQFQVLEE